MTNRQAASLAGLWLFIGGWQPQDCSAADPVGTSRTIVTKVLHTGDPAPGVPGATAAWVGKPQIDDSGAVAFEGFLTGPGINGSNDLILWYGHPGALQVVAREGLQVPGLPIGVVYDDWEVTYTMGSDGTFAIGAILAGPGVIPGLNDKALLIGHAGQLHPVIRANAPAPGFPDGVVVTPEQNYFAEMTDDGRFLTRFIIAGPGVNDTNDKVYWAIDGAGWRQIVRTGDQAPGCPSGAVFAWMDGVLFNTNMTIAFRGGVTGPGVTINNDLGYWSGPPGNLQLVIREGDPAPDVPPGANLLYAGSLPGIQSEGDVTFNGSLIGNGVTPENDRALYVGSPGQLMMAVREDDSVPGQLQDIRIHRFSFPVISTGSRLMFAAQLRGEVAPTEDRGIFFGSYASQSLELREGSSVQGLDPLTMLNDDLFGIGAMNDAGCAVQVVGVSWPSAGDSNNVLIVARHPTLGRWYPMVRDGDTIGERHVSVGVIQNALDVFWTTSGGSDGLRQSLDPSGRLACTLTFADGSLGCYLLALPQFGDANGDKIVDVFDFERFLSCQSNPGRDLIAPDCAIFDIDFDGDVDKSDFAGVQIFVGSHE